jgi:hypothetical protein
MTWWTVLSLAFLALAIVGGLVICIVTSVNSYAKRLSEPPKVRQPRGFEVKPTAGGEQAPALREKDDHHG